MTSVVHSNYYNIISIINVPVQITLGVVVEGCDYCLPGGDGISGGGNNWEAAESLGDADFLTTGGGRGGGIGTDDRE